MNYEKHFVVVWVGLKNNTNSWNSNLIKWCVDIVKIDKRIIVNKSWLDGLKKIPWGRDVRKLNSTLWEWVKMENMKSGMERNLQIMQDHRIFQMEEWKYGCKIWRRNMKKERNGKEEMKRVERE